MTRSDTPGHAILLTANRPADEFDAGVNPADPQGWVVAGALTTDSPGDDSFEITAYAVCVTPN